MRTKLPALALLVVLAPAAVAEEPSSRLQRFVERTPPPLVPPTPQPWPDTGLAPLGRHVRPSTGNYQAGGTVGGGTQFFGRVHRRETAPPTTATAGVFGYDFAGFGSRPGRTFLSSAGAEAGPAIGRSYRTAATFYADPIAKRPVRNAVIEAREGGEKRGGD